MTKFEILQKYRAEGQSNRYRKLIDSWAVMGKNFIHSYSGTGSARSTRYFTKDLLYILHISPYAGALNGALLYCTESFSDTDLSLKWEDLEVLDYDQGYVSFGNNIWSPNFRILLLPQDVFTAASVGDGSIYSDDPAENTLNNYRTQSPSFVPFAEEEKDSDQVQIAESDYNEIMSCLGATFIQEEELEYSRTEICNLAIRPALREFFKWCPAVMPPTVETVSRQVQEIDMPSEAYGVSGISLQQNGMNAMGDTTSPFAYAWEQSYYGGGGSNINIGLGLMNTSIKGVATNGITNTLQNRALAQAMINYSRRVHYEGPYERADGTRYIKLYSNTQGTFNIWWAKKSLNFDDVRYTQKENAIALCQAKVMQLFGNLRRQIKSDVPGMVDWSYLVSEGKTLWDETVKNLKEIVKGEGILRGSLG